MSRPRAKLHEVTVTASKDADEFRFDAGSEIWDESISGLCFRKDHHGLTKKDYHLIEFVLTDRTGEGLTFPNAPHQAMWVTKANAGDKHPCPNAETPSDYSVIEPMSISDDRRRLIVRNDNPERERWAFTLNFVKREDHSADASHYVSWDPIIDNHNGG
ncbi:MAG TPA: hypothetical protein VE968_09230 [Sphingomicrobium sp.]|nr:hypothetical protein [Sphingomicrobium sp.]